MATEGDPRIAAETRVTTMSDATTTPRRAKRCELSNRRQLKANALAEVLIEFVPTIDYSAVAEEEIDWSQLNESRILTAVEERFYFLQMNRAFFAAAKIREDIAGSEISVTARAEFDRLIQRGRRLRNGLAITYAKLVRSIARGFVTPRVPFDELVSEADEVALRALTMFNPEYGFRFSTYATHAVRRRLLRFVKREQSEREVCIDWQEHGLIETRRWTHDYERTVWEEIQHVEQLLTLLSPRERYVVRSRFGWGREFDVRTLQDLADEQGVSRERIRQLESRALSKLRQYARREPLSNA